jgi:hypothetical protein
MKIRQNLLVQQVAALVLGSAVATSLAMILPAAYTHSFGLAGLVLGALCVAQPAIISRATLKLQPCRIQSFKQP